MGWQRQYVAATIYTLVHPAGKNVSKLWLVALSLTVQVRTIPLIPPFPVLRSAHDITFTEAIGSIAPVQGMSYNDLYLSHAA